MSSNIVLPNLTYTLPPLRSTKLAIGCPLMLLVWGIFFAVHWYYTTHFPVPLVDDDSNDTTNDADAGDTEGGQPRNVGIRHEEMQAHPEERPSDLNDGNLTTTGGHGEDAPLEGESGNGGNAALLGPAGGKEGREQVPLDDDEHEALASLWVKEHTSAFDETPAVTGGVDLDAFLEGDIPSPPQLAIRDYGKPPRARGDSARSATASHPPVPLAEESQTHQPSSSALSHSHRADRVTPTAVASAVSRRDSLLSVGGGSSGRSRSPAANAPFVEHPGGPGGLGRLPPDGTSRGDDRSPSGRGLPLAPTISHQSANSGGPTTASSVFLNSTAPRRHDSGGSRPPHTPPFSPPATFVNDSLPSAGGFAPPPGTPHSLTSPGGASMSFASAGHLGASNLTSPLHQAPVTPSSAIHSARKGHTLVPFDDLLDDFSGVGAGASGGSASLTAGHRPQGASSSLLLSGGHRDESKVHGLGGTSNSTKHPKDSLNAFLESDDDEWSAPRAPQLRRASDVLKSLRPLAETAHPPPPTRRNIQSDDI